MKDIGLHGATGASTTGVNDVGARASTGQQYAVADRQGDWTAIWYLGQKAWFHNPASDPTAVDSVGAVITPKQGLASIPVYGRAYPEASAYPAGVPVQSLSPMPYTVPAGQRYVVGGVEHGRVLLLGHLRHRGPPGGAGQAAVLRDPARAPGGVRARVDVTLLPSVVGAPH